MMKFFIRTEEKAEAAEDALRRGRSLRRWAFAGNPLTTHIRFDFDRREKIEAVETALSIRGEDMSDWFEEDECGIVPEPESLSDDELSDLFDDLVDEEHETAIAEALGFERLGKGWARFHEGLCALDGFEYEPAIEELEGLDEQFGGTLFEYLVCYEGEYVGRDEDEGWPLFRPIRILWVKKTNELLPNARITEREMH